MEQIYFKTQELNVGYNGKPLIKDINISVNKGEILTLIGPNGSGKSTILKSITKQLKLLGGTVLIDKDCLNNMTVKELSKKQAVVLTERLQTEMMCCWDVVATGRYPYTNQLGTLNDEDYEKVQDAMETVHAFEIRDKDFDAISDGQRQRIMLARAICQEPEIIILDEPTSFLDIRHKLELLDILRKMAKEKNITVIMSLHEIDLAQKISDRIMCVKGEYIEKVGTPAEIFKNETIHDLYEVEKGTYNILFGSIELPAAVGEPQIFVLAGNGAGIGVYRALQKTGIPFSTGILAENDVDCQVANVLAGKVIKEKAFTSIRPEQIAAAREEIKRCRKVIDAGAPIGEWNAVYEQILTEAKEAGKLISLEELLEKGIEK